MAVVILPSEPTIKADLPPNAFWGEDGLLYHKVERMTEGGTKVLQTRRLATSAEEARNSKLDFYHPKLGLIWEGYKLASDRRVNDILNDSSVGGLMPPGTPTPSYAQ